MRRMRFRSIAAIVFAASAVASCSARTDTAFYLGSWDLAHLTWLGAQPVGTTGISFSQHEVCYLGFSSECYPANYSVDGDVVGVIVEGRQDTMLLRPGEFGRLIVVRGEGEELYVRR